MSTEIFIKDGRRMSNKLRDELKKEKGKPLGPYKGDRGSLYLIATRHANKDRPYTLWISDDLLRRMKDSVPLTGNSTSIPETIGELKPQTLVAAQNISEYIRRIN